MRYVIPFLLTLATLFGIQSLALRASGGRTVKSESNFFSSLGRIQAGAHGNLHIQFLGSSITGRLPDRAQGVEGVANMGCDGGSAVDVLRAMDEGIIPVANVLVVEANTLQLALTGKTTTIHKAIRRLWFQIGIDYPSVAAYARPAAFFYSKLLAKKIGGFGGGDEVLAVTGGFRRVAAHKIAQSSIKRDEKMLIGELTALFSRLEKKGTVVFLVWLPPGRPAGEAAPQWILSLAAQSGLPWWDLGQEVGPDAVTLTDGIHMDAKSAARAMHTVLIGIDRWMKAGVPE